MFCSGKCFIKSLSAGLLNAFATGGSGLLSHSPTPQENLKTPWVSASLRTPFFCHREPINGTLHNFALWFSLGDKLFSQDWKEWPKVSGLFEEQLYRVLWGEAGRLGWIRSSWQEHALNGWMET